MGRKLHCKKLWIKGGKKQENTLKKKEKEKKDVKYKNDAQQEKWWFNMKTGIPIP
jgi:hypothetical protein